MMDNVKSEIASNVFRSASSLAAFENFLRALPIQFSAPELNSGTAFSQPGQAAAPAQSKSDVVSEAIEAAAPIKRDTPKVGRNEPCPCGSGKKYKNCCGRNA